MTCANGQHTQCYASQSVEKKIENTARSQKVHILEGKSGKSGKAAAKARYQQKPRLRAQQVAFFAQGKDNPDEKTTGQVYQKRSQRKTVRVSFAYPLLA